MMLLTLAGVLCVVLGGKNEEKKEVEDSAVPILVLYILLFSNPILSGGGQVAMRSMGKVNNAVIPWYLQVSVLIFSAIIMLIFGQSFTIYSEFDQISWLLSLAMAATSVISESFRFKAFKYQKASTLQLLIPVAPLFQFIFDVTFFDENYMLLQYLALLFLAILYIIQGVKLFVDKKNNQFEPKIETKEEKDKENGQITENIPTEANLVTENDAPNENEKAIELAIKD